MLNPQCLLCLVPGYFLLLSFSFLFQPFLSISNTSLIFQVIFSFSHSHHESVSCSDLIPSFFFFKSFPQVILSFTIFPFHNFPGFLIVVLKGSSLSCDSDVLHHAMSCLNILKDFATPLKIIYA